jgi:hypothetical protein
MVSLFDNTQASRAACCVRIAGLLGTPGVVSVLDADGTVSFAAGHGDDSAAQPLGLRQLDERVPRVVNDVGMSRTVAYLAVAPQLPMLAEALKPSIEQWRTMPFAGGLRD